jgi:hypothetical protein
MTLATKSVLRLPSLGGLTLSPNRKPMEQNNLYSSPRMVDHYKETQRVYNEGKPHKTPKKKQKKHSVNSPTLSNLTKNLDTPGDFEFYLPHQHLQGRGQLCKQTGGGKDPVQSSLAFILLSSGNWTLQELCAPEGLAAG